MGKGLLDTLRKRSRLLAGLGLVTAVLGFGGIAAKKGAEKIASVRIERIMERAAQNESLSRMPKKYTDKFQALDDVIVLRKAWQMLSNPYSIDRYAEEFVNAQQNYAHLSDKKQHDYDLLKRAIGLAIAEGKKLPSQEYSESRKKALSDLKERFDSQLKLAQDGHGLLKGVSRNVLGGIQCGSYQFQVGLEANSFAFESSILSDVYKYTPAEREGYLQKIRQQILKDNPAELTPNPRTGGRGG